MLHHLIINAAIAMSGGSSTENPVMDANPVFNVTIACRDDARCIFRHEDVYFNIIIKNVNDTAIKIPLDFIRDSGPDVTLHDNRLKRSEIVPSNMRKEDLLTNLTVLGPGQSVSIPWSISGAQLEEWGGADVDVTAEIEVAAPLDQTLTFRLIGAAKFRIMGTEVADRAGRPHDR